MTVLLQICFSFTILAIDYPPLKILRSFACMRKILFGAFWLASLCVFADTAEAFTTKDICISVEGVRVCVQPRGQCGIDHIIGGEKSKLRMEMFHISISNNSGRKVKVLPENFYGVTEQGLVVVLDAPFYESIELRTKLRRHDVAPNGEVKGLLLLPSSMGRIRTIVYGGNPAFEISLF
jgi:hypothetical protein